ncbi:MAG: tail fiber domain-containing protein, partial [Planctomycetes bacterium]|nr:tail fiber domain-containing protein [Planctomycetota bacterium]
HGQSDFGTGVHGGSESGDGVSGFSDSGNGVYGHSNSQKGVWGYSWTNDGVYGDSPTGNGIHGRSTSGGYAGYFEGQGYFSNRLGIGTTNPTSKLDVAGSDGTNPLIRGINSSHGAGVYGQSSSGYGVYGKTSGTTITSYGVYGENLSAGQGGGVLGQDKVNGNYGILGSIDGGVQGIAIAGIGVFGSSNTGTGVWGRASISTNFGGYFEGRGYFSNRVGIGTDTPDQMLHVYGESNPRILVEAPANASPEFNLKRGTQAWGLWMDSDNDLNFFQNGNKVTFAADGDVGIGTSSPEKKLHVSGGSILLDNNQSITMKDTNGYYSGHLSLDDSDNLRLTNGATGGEIEFWTSDIPSTTTQQAVLTSDGKFGIGTIFPAYTLDISGSANLNKSETGPALSVQGVEALWYEGDYFSWGYGANFNYFARPVGIGTINPGSWELYVVGDAYKTAGGSSWNVASDIRLKDVHGEYEYGLEQICQITPVRFNYKKDNELSLSPDHQQIGVVAQEVQKVIPDAVSETDEGYLSLNMDPVVMAMLNAIKQQQKQIEVMQGEIETLKNQLQTTKR